MLLTNLNLTAHLYLLFHELRQFHREYAVLNLGGDGVLLHVIRQYQRLLKL